jgi:hypothetical protein
MSTLISSGDQKKSFFRGDILYHWILIQLREITVQVFGQSKLSTPGASLPFGVASSL